MEIVVVSDTNIFIDLYKVELLDEFFSFRPRLFGNAGTG